MSCMINVAVNVFETDATGKTVVGVTASGCSTLVTPKHWMHVPSDVRTPTATPGTERNNRCSSLAVRNRSSMLPPECRPSFERTSR